MNVYKTYFELCVAFIGSQLVYMCDWTVRLISIHVQHNSFQDIYIFLRQGSLAFLSVPSRQNHHQDIVSSAI